MPLAVIKEICIWPGCREPVSEHHHVVYDSNDSERHYWCRKSVKKGNSSVDHRAEIVPICRTHHQSITDFNERAWVVFNRYHPLSCAQRRHLFELWLNGKYPEGIEPFLDGPGGQMIGNSQTRPEK